jgi:polyhydroxyalkanoate synthesis regulator phasin
MWHTLRIGAALIAVVGLIMSGLAVAHAVDESGVVDTERPGTGATISEALAPLVEDGTLTQGQAEAVVEELAPLVARARFQERTRELVGQLGRLAAEIAEVQGMIPNELGEQLAAGRTLTEIAEAHGSTGDQLVAQVTDHVAAHLAVQVTAGKLDQQRADEVVARTEQTLTELIDVEHPFGTILEQRRHQALRWAGLDAAAEALGLAVAGLRTQLEEGNTLAQIADAQGVDEDSLIEAILAPAAQRIQRAVERGRLTDDQASEALDRATEQVSEAIHKVPGI